MNTKKKIILSSVLTIALCLSLIAGSTFALFTDSSSVNIAVTAGKVDVEAIIEGIELYSPKSISANGNVIDDTDVADHENNLFKNGGSAELKLNELKLDKVTPGDKVTATIKITNNSNVAIQYRTILKSGEGDNELLNGLKVTFGEGESAQSFTGTTIKSEWAAYEGTDPQTIQVTIELPATAGNAYQEKSCSLIFTVEAVQGNAQMPDDEWDGSSVEAPEQDEDGVYHITNAAQFAQYIDSFSGLEGPSYRGQYYNAKVVLDCNIDLGGATIERTSASYFYGQFDGKNYVISNFVLKGTSDTGFTSLFAAFDNTAAFVKNLTVENATVVATQGQAAVVANAVYSGTVENCHTINCTVVGEKKVGAVVSYVQENGAVKDCSATGCRVFASDDREDQATLFGYDNGGTFTNNTDKGGNTIETGVTGTFVTSAADLKTALAVDGANVVLLNDISVTGSWTPVAVDVPDSYHFAQSISIDGNGHSISGLNAPLLAGNTAKDITIKNLTIKKSNINSGDEGDLGRGAFIAYRDSFNAGTITMENCHLVESTVTATSGAGALIGYVAQNNVSIKSCSATKCTISGEKVGGLIGSYQVETGAFKNCTVSGCEFNGTECNGQLAGQVFGGGTLTISGCTYTGEAFGRNVGATVSEN